VFEVGDLWPETPIVMGALRNPLLKAAARWLERFAYRNSSRIVALSPGMKAGICRTGYLEEHVAVIPNCSDIGMFRVPAERGQEWRRAHPEIGDRPMVLYAGTLGRINGVGWLARCAAATAKLDPEIRFVTVGGGIETDQVRQEAERCGVLGSNFFMYPPVKKGDVLAILSACSLSTSVVINVPELWNNSANKFFDSLAAGRPIAINHPGWQAELLQASGAGLVLPYGDLPGAARLLVDKLRDPSWLPDARVAAARLAEERFSSELLGQHLETVFLAAVADHGQPQVRRG
jgi:glycosyltransferase involved in cell wall biosynthesis